MDSLQVKIQVDRLPDVPPEEEPSVQLGIRLSAFLSEISEENSEKNVEPDLILPWKWKNSDSGSWNPHHKSTWTVWHIKKGDSGPQLYKVPEDYWEPAPELENSTAEDGSPTEKPVRLWPAIDAEIEAIYKAGGKKSLLPPDERYPKNRTIYGFVETLSSMPHPVPVKTRIWTAITIKPEYFNIKEHKLDESDRFAAVPCFATCEGVYYSTDTTPSRISSGVIEIKMNGESHTRTAVVKIRSSLPMTLLKIPESDSQRLMDLASLFVEKKEEAGWFENTDWVPHLGSKLRELFSLRKRAVILLDTEAEKFGADTEKRKALLELTGKLAEALPTDLDSDSDSDSDRAVSEFFASTKSREAFEDKIRKEVQGNLKFAFSALNPDAQNEEVLEEWSHLHNLCKLQAELLIQKLLPAADSLAADDDMISEDALPLTFAVDQLFGVPDKIDLWANVAGVGVLLGRTTSGEEAAVSWWSLNKATLHFPGRQNGKRESLGESNAVVLWEDSGEDEKWYEKARVDPVPLALGACDGIRDITVRYDSRSLVAEMSGDLALPAMDGNQTKFQRFEAYLFPKEFKLPPLTFGRTYHVVPYLVGHGGVLPLALREHDNQPVRRLPSAGNNGVLTISKAKRDELNARAGKKTYKRTVPVSAPRLLENSSWPGPMDGVSPLASELPRRLPPFTLQQDNSAFFYRDKEQRGILSGPYSGAGKDCLRLDFPTCYSRCTGGVSLEMVISDGDNQVLKLMIPLRNTERKGLRVRIERETVTVETLEYPEGDSAEAAPATTMLEGCSAVRVTPPSQWSAAFLQLRSKGADIELEPPVVYWAASQEGGQEPVYDMNRPILPPEVPEVGMNLSILDGIGGNSIRNRQSATLELGWPTTSLMTFDRWVNGPLGGYGTANENDIRSLLKEAYKYAGSAETGKAAAALYDPAVEALAIEVVQVFPKRRSFGVFKITDENQKPGIGKDKSVRVRIVTDKETTVTEDGQRVEVAPGHVCELRIYGVIPDTQAQFAPAASTTAARFSRAARQNWRVWESGGKHLHLAAPLVLTVEVATKRMPELYENGSFRIELVRPPAVPSERAIFRLQDALLKDSAMRYVDRIALFCQRWSWRGRPHPELPAIRNNGSSTFMADEMSPFVDALFLGRSIDDIGPVREIVIGRAHACPAVSGKEPELMEKDLEYRGGANIWRFALRAKSRYAAMRPDDKQLLSYSHWKENEKVVRWKPFYVWEYSGPSTTPRKPVRPGLLLVLPLTEPLMAGGAVPPLLAIFNHAMFSLFNVADGIEAQIEVARHPCPEGEAVRYWPEYGMDPIRTGAATDGTPLALRCDGPIGYTFDLDAEVGRFDHSGVLVSPVAGSVKSWTLAKLRFRRLEAPEFLRAGDGTPCCRSVSPGESKQVALSASNEKPDADFPANYEGIAVDINELEEEADETLTFACADQDCGTDSVAITVKVINNQDLNVIKVWAKKCVAGADESTKPWSLKIKPGRRIQIRVIVAQLPVPPGTTQSVPMADISVKVRVTPKVETDSLMTLHEGSWMSVISLSLHGKPGPVEVSRGEGGGASKVVIRPVRLSAYTPGVWCQFADNMSHFRVTYDGNEWESVHASELKATVQTTGESSWFVLTRADKLYCKGLTTCQQTDSKAQIEERLYAVVTRYIHDAFDRIREKPIAIHPVNMDVATTDRLLQKATWPTAHQESLYGSGSGRLRIIRVLQSKEISRGGFTSSARTFPDDFFGRDDCDSNNPRDGAGQVLGISIPIEWEAENKD